MKRIRRFPVFTVWLFCLAVLAIFDRCTFKKPVTPSWDVRFELPLFDSTYTMQALADHNEKLFTTDPVSDDIILKIDKGPESFAVGKYLTATAVTNLDQFDFTGIGALGPSRTISDSLVMENDILVQDAEFEDGSVDFEFTNSTGYTMAFTIFLRGPVFSPLPGDSIRLPENVPPNTSHQSVPLRGMIFKPRISIDHKNNIIDYTAKMYIVRGASSGNNIVNVNVNLVGLRYQRVTGWLNRTEVDIDSTVDTGIKVSDVFRGIQIGSATLVMNFVNEIRFPATFDLTLTGYAEDGRSETIQIPPQDVGASTTFQTDPIEFSKIVNLLPKTLRLKGKAFVGKGFEGDSAVINKDDLVKASIHLEAPLIFKLPSATNTSKVDTIKIEEDAREKIQKNALDAKLVFEIENAVPLGAAVSFCFSKSRSDTLLYKNADLIKTISLDSARTRIDPTDPNVRIVSQASTNDISFDLSKAELKVFESPKVFWQRRITFYGTSSMVKVRPEDYIHVHARIETTINTDFEKEDKQKGGGP